MLKQLMTCQALVIDGELAQSDLETFLHGCLEFLKLLSQD